MESLAGRRTPRRVCRMTAPATPASRKSAERQRRKDAGEVRVETYLEPHLLAVVDRFARTQGSRSEALRCIVWNVERMEDAS